MKNFLLPVALVVVGVGTGVGAGLFLRPDAPAGAEHDAALAADAHDGTGGGGENAAPASHAKPAHGGSSQAGDSHASSGGHREGGHAGGGEEYLKLDNQFVVPILDDSRVRSLVVLSIDLEVGPAGVAGIYRVEPKIRDAFLTVLFDHANAGGFNGTFTSSGSMEILRRSLREAGWKAVGENVVSDVLITGIVRQDI